MDKLQKAKKSISVTKTIRTGEDSFSDSEKPPKGAEIVSTEQRIEHEQIENGWLTITRIEVRWKKQGSTDYPKWYTNTKKVYSEENPNPEIDEEDEMGVAEMF